MATETTDILLDAQTGDLAIQGGDFAIRAGEQQHIEHILLSQKGNWREHPLCGVGLADYLNSGWSRLERTALDRKIRAQLELDGLRPRRLRLDSPDRIDIEAVRKK